MKDLRRSIVLCSKASMSFAPAIPASTARPGFEVKRKLQIGVDIAHRRSCEMTADVTWKAVVVSAAIAVGRRDRGLPRSRKETNR
jgi:hypothetical protein